MAECVLPAAAWNPSPLPPGSSVPDLASECGVMEQQPQPRTPPSSPAQEPGTSTDPDIPHPDLAPVVFFCLRQTTSPRNWCIKMVCNPYPLRLFPSCHQPINPPWASSEQVGAGLSHALTSWLLSSWSGLQHHRSQEGKTEQVGESEGLDQGGTAGEKRKGQREERFWNLE